MSGNEVIKIVRMLVERDTPKKPVPLVNVYTDGQFRCRVCNWGLIANPRYQTRFCGECGQRQDWSEFFPNGSKG